MLTRGAHDERAGDIYTAAGANVGEMGDDMGVRSSYTSFYQNLFFFFAKTYKINNVPFL